MDEPTGQESSTDRAIEPAVHHAIDAAVQRCPEDFAGFPGGLGVDDGSCNGTGLPMGEMGPGIGCWRGEGWSLVTSTATGEGWGCGGDDAGGEGDVLGGDESAAGGKELAEVGVAEVLVGGGEKGGPQNGGDGGQMGERDFPGGGTGKRRKRAVADDDDGAETGAMGGDQKAVEEGEGDEGKSGGVRVGDQDGGKSRC